MGGGSQQDNQYSICKYFVTADDGNYGGCYLDPPQFVISCVATNTPNDPGHWRYPTVSSNNWCSHFVAAGENLNE